MKSVRKHPPARLVLPSMLQPMTEQEEARQSEKTFILFIQIG